MNLSYSRKAKKNISIWALQFCPIQCQSTALDQLPILGNWHSRQRSWLQRPLAVCWQS